jgi:hypothetical protein
MALANSDVSPQPLEGFCSRYLNISEPSALQKQKWRCLNNRYFEGEQRNISKTKFAI